MRRFCTSIRLGSVLGPGAPMLYPSFLGPAFFAALPLLHALKQSTQARFRRSTVIRGERSRFEFLSLDIWICFGFRASDFGFGDRALDFGFETSFLFSAARSGQGSGPKSPTAAYTVRRCDHVLPPRVLEKHLGEIGL